MLKVWRGHAHDRAAARWSQYRLGMASSVSVSNHVAMGWQRIAIEQAANPRARAELTQQIATIVKKNRWTQTEAARNCGNTQPRMNDLLRGSVPRFSLDTLVNIATLMGRRVHMELEAA